MTKPPYVMVEWTDARNVLEQDLTLDEALAKAKLAHRTSVGYLLLKDAERTVLACDYDPAQPSQDEDNYGNLTVIPSGWVTAVHRLRRETARRKKATENDGTSKPPEA